MLSIEPWITETRTAHSDEFLAEIKSQSIIHRRGQVLLRPQVPFRRLYGGIAQQQQLDLLQIITGPPAQLRTRTPQIMGRGRTWLSAGVPITPQSDKRLLACENVIFSEARTRIARWH